MIPFLLISVIDREEGFRALFKGGPARVIRSSPQFGFTLLGEIDVDSLLICSLTIYVIYSIRNSKDFREYLVSCVINLPGF